MQLIRTTKTKSFVSHHNNIKILCLENINKSAIQIFESEGFEVKQSKDSLSLDDLKSLVKETHVVCIRSKTKITREIIESCENLLAIGCFCIGYNQVDLLTCIQNGLPVFNSPFCNSRSVAELVIGEIIMLSRQLGDRNIEMHGNVWNKQSAKCFEIRSKTLGIVGYGHIGTQLSVLAESMGMNVCFYDTENIMPIGSANPKNSLIELLNVSDFVTLHVPEKQDTLNMINELTLKEFKKNSYLINASRGSVVDLQALKKYLDNGHILGAALDVYPTEPEKSKYEFKCEMSQCKNVILTPHIGGSTEEAQYAIGIEVASKLVNFIKFGNSIGAINYPNLKLRPPRLKIQNKYRILFAHKNVPGILKEINNKLAKHYNVDSQCCDSKKDLAYLMVDIHYASTTEDKIEYEQELNNLLLSISGIENSINTRIICWNDLVEASKGQ